MRPRRRPHRRRVRHRRRRRTKTGRRPTQPRALPPAPRRARRLQRLQRAFRARSRPQPPRRRRAWREAGARGAAPSTPMPCQAEARQPCAAGPPRGRDTPAQRQPAAPWPPPPRSSADTRQRRRRARSGGKGLGSARTHRLLYDQPARAGVLQHGHVRVGEDPEQVRGAPAAAGAGKADACVRGGGVMRVRVARWRTGRAR